jgi:hypothetical protein
VSVRRVNGRAECYSDLGVGSLSVSICDGCFRPLPEEHLHEDGTFLMAHGWGMCGLSMPAGFCDENCRDLFKSNALVADLERRGFKVHTY